MLWALGSALGAPLWAVSSGPWAPTASPIAQSPEPKTPSAIQVFLITIGEGAQYYEKFGHNALWFSDPARSVDIAYNWGTFDFNEPGFLRRLLIGDTRYWVDGVPAQLLLDFYRQYDRTVVVQRLNLTADQAQRAYQYAQWNAREENKYYQYDYFRDNCSTRVRDVIDLAVGGALKSATSDTRVNRTYRLESLRLVDDMPLTQFGIDMALGQPADRLLTVWEDMFVPSRMRDAIREIRVPGIGAVSVPLVAEERVVYQSRGHQERADFPTRWLPYLIVGLLIGAELFVMARVGQRSSPADKVFRVEATILAFVLGLLGVVLLLAWLTTRHVFWFRNENLLLLNPLALFLAVLIPMSMRRARWLRPAAICAVILAMLGALALALKGVPGFSQNNVPMILLLLPVHFAVAYGLWRRVVPRD